MNYRYLKIHAKRLKAHNVLMIQLKTNKIKLNQFLHERRISDVLIAHCLYDDDIMIIKHILLFCSNSKEKKRKILNKIKITNVKRILSKRKTITIAICIISTTDLLS